jgi:hypothetical protein
MKNKITKNNKRGLLAVRRGMSFMEAIIGIFIFTVVMLAVTTIFTSSFGGYRKADKMAQNIEDANFALNDVAKTLRTSVILGCYNPGCGTAATVDTKEIRFFDYSQTLCGRFVFSSSSGGRLLMQKSDSSVDTAALCLSATFPTQVVVTNGFVDGNFLVTRSWNNVAPTPDQMGKVTMRIKVCSDLNCLGAKNDSVVLQTTVSSRDYTTVGL